MMSRMRTINIQNLCSNIILWLNIITSLPVNMEMPIHSRMVKIQAGASKYQELTISCRASALNIHILLRVTVV